MEDEGLKTPLAKMIDLKTNPSSGGGRGRCVVYICIPSAGITQIRFVGRERVALLSANESWLPKQFIYYVRV
jgi:hypothetical protein